MLIAIGCMSIQAHGAVLLYLIIYVVSLTGVICCISNLKSPDNIQSEIKNTVELSSITH